MPTEIPVLIVQMFVVLMVGFPLTLGLLCRKLAGRRAKPLRPMWLTVAQLLTILGWGSALALGKLEITSYPASVLLGAVLYAPGLFLWGFHARRSNSI